MKNPNLDLIFLSGEIAGGGLREASDYEGTHEQFLVHGLIEAVLNATPPVGVNFQILAEQIPEAVDVLQKELSRSPSCTFLGLASTDGPSDLLKLLRRVGVDGWQKLTVVDIDQGIVSQVGQLNLDHIDALLEDARDTSIVEETQHVVVADHVGNCCPPDIWPDIVKEARRVLNPDGFAIVNITTNERLCESAGREVISLDALSEVLGDEAIQALHEDIFSLAELRASFPDLQASLLDQLRGKILEIAPKNFVVFGEDENGHGEWFGSLEWQLKLVTDQGFEICAHHQRAGTDSHNPPLECNRHIFLLRRKIDEMRSKE